MSAHSGADEEVLYKPFAVQAILMSIAGPCRVRERDNFTDSKIVSLEKGSVANSTRYKRTK